MQTCYIDGDYDATLDMIKFLKNHCRSLGVKKIYGFTCNHKPITSALEKLGFEPSDSTMIVYKDTENAQPGRAVSIHMNFLWSVLG